MKLLLQGLSPQLLRFSMLINLLLIKNLTAHAQLQTSQWYFGHQAGLDFRFGEPIPLTDGLLNTEEGCSSRADSVGNLLFYTDGITVWNRQHQVMAGGANLLGNTSTAQYLVVAQPGNRHRYYLFSPDEYSQFAKFRYSEIDMRRQDGLGEVVRKSIQLHSSSTERVTAVPHANGRDLWIIGHERNTNVFFAYSLTAQGLATSPMLSTDDFVHQSTQVIGQLKASPNGRQLALTAATIDPQKTRGVPSIELLDFDPATGRITNPILIPPARITSYGVEFSPDGSKLYVTDPAFTGLFQYDLTASNIPTSLVQIPIVTSPGNSTSSKAGLQLGPNGKIYVALANTTAQALGVISEPNRLGAACAYVDQGLSLNGRSSAQGLPSFMQQDLWHFTVRGACQQSLISFAFPIIYGADSVRWNFGDPSSPYNSAMTLAPTHTYSTPGRYLVTLTLYLPSSYPFLIRRYVDVAPLPVVNLGRDTTLCPGQIVVLNATTPDATYRWQDSTTTATLRAQQPGWYWVDVTSAGGCTTRDSLRLSAAPVPHIQLSADTVLCVGQTLILRPRKQEAGIRYHWSDGSAGSTLTVRQPGTYWLEGTNAAGCSQRDSLHLYYLTPPTIYLGADTSLCSTTEQPFTLNATLPGVTYRWQDGSTRSTFTPTESGTYWVTVSTAVCNATDSIRVRLYDCQQQVFVPNIITPNGDGRNDQLQIIGLGSEVWSLRIFSRWGQMVYSTENYRQDWDAAGLSVGSYYYLLQEPMTQRRIQGWIQVIR